MGGLKALLPKYSFEYNRASPNLLSLSCNTDNMEGIYIKRVYPNSCISILKNGDILFKIIYNDIYLNNPSAFDIINRTHNNGTSIIASLDKFGDVSLSETSYRKLTLKELFDIIPVNTKIDIQICRSDSNKVCDPMNKSCLLFQISTNFQYKPSKIRYPLYPRFTPYKYEIIAGLSISELTMNHIVTKDSLDEYGKGKNRFKQVLVINQIFPDTTVYHTKIFRKGTILKEINGQKVSTLYDLNSAILKSNNYITIISKNYDKFVVKKENAIHEDLNLIQEFNLTNYKYLLS